MEEKKCNKCQKVFKLGNFYSNGPVLQSWCKYCESVRKRKYYPKLAKI